MKERCGMGGAVWMKGENVRVGVVLVGICIVYVVVCGCVRICQTLRLL